MALAGLIENRRQPEGWPNSLRVPEARWNVDRADKGQGYDRTHARDGHQPLTDFIVSDFAPIDPVLQHQIECPAGKMLAAGHPSAGSFTALAHETQPVEFGLEQRDRAQFRIAPEDQPGSRSLRLIHDQFAVLDVIAERHVAAHPHALALRGRDFVADA